MDLYDQRKENKSLSTLIFEKIREDILEKKYKPGDKLIEVKLAEELGVSRTPVREALKQMELDGLVENIPNRGVIVKGISDQDILDIYTIRTCIEALVAQWAAERISDQEMKEIEEIFDLMEFYTMKNDVEKLFELNTKFHETLYKATKSRYLEHMMKEFQFFIKTTRLLSLQSEGRKENALEEHRLIVAGLRERDVKKTRLALMSHVNNSNQNIKENVIISNEE